MQSYTEAKQYLSGARNPNNGRPLENNTRLIKTDDGYGIKLHDTVVVEYLKTGKIRLNTDGWQTRTSKDRINSYVPSGVYVQSTKNVWHIGDFEYFDGIIINQDGIPLKKHQKSLSKAKEKAKQFDKVLNRYAEAFIKEITASGFKEPSGGDCWGCLGMMAGGDHLYSHLRENYFVPTLLVKAMRETGFQDFAIGYFLKDPSSNKATLKRAIKKHFNKHRTDLLKMFKTKDFKSAATAKPKKNLKLVVNQ